MGSCAIADSLQCAGKQCGTRACWMQKTIARWRASFYIALVGSDDEGASNAGRRCEIRGCGMRRRMACWRASSLQRRSATRQSRRCAVNHLAWSMLIKASTVNQCSAVSAFRLCRHSPAIRLEPAGLSICLPCRSRRSMGTWYSFGAAAARATAPLCTR